MGLENEPDTNPYAEQTAANTSPAWLTTTPVDVDLDGLREYAGHMADQQSDLLGQAMGLQRLTQMPAQAWGMDALGEAAFVQSQVMANAKELSTYLGMLGTTLQNIGNAAQTVADSYNSADGTSAASLNAVLFAFGDPDATRPGGLPPHLGRTYSEAMLEAQMEAPPAAEEAPVWGPTTITNSSQFGSTEIAYAGDQRRETVTSHYPGSPTTTVTTTIYGPGNVVVSTTVQRTTSSYDSTTNSVVTRVESSRNGEHTGTTETSNRYAGGEVVETTATSYAPDAQGNDQERQTRTETIAEDGSRTETVTRPGEDGRPVTTDRVEIGAETEDTPLATEPIAEEYTPPLPGM